MYLLHSMYFFLFAMPIYTIMTSFMSYEIFKVNYIIHTKRKKERELQTYSRLVNVTMTEKPRTVPDRISYIF